ncbi:MAG: Rieske 2Fe-2S domain-containing protein [Dehalococcoidia bacterium]
MEIPLKIAAEEVSPGTMKAVEINGRTLIVANVEGRYVAFSSECPHEGADMGKGKLDGMAVWCTNHQFLFDLNNGELLESDGDDCPSLPVFDVVDQEGTLCLRIDI